LGLEFNLQSISIAPDPTIDFKNDPGIYKLVGTKLRNVGNTVDDLHESTVERLKKRGDYRSKNLAPIISELELD
jgi:hypothetical protein